MRHIPDREQDPMRISGTIALRANRADIVLFENRKRAVIVRPSLTAVAEYNITIFGSKKDTPETCKHVGSC